MKLRLLSVGKSKDQYIKKGVEEYQKRIGGYADLEIVYLPDVPLSSTNNRDLVISKEGTIICRYLDERRQKFNKSPYIISLDAEGKMFDSPEFAGLIEDKGENHELLFIIGGVYGLSGEVKERSDLLLSMSKLTFTHQMTRIILLEQLYRAFTIIRGKMYHY